jgi:hypothetical protein
LIVSQVRHASPSHAPDPSAGVTPAADMMTSLKDGDAEGLPTLMPQPRALLQANTLGITFPLSLLGRADVAIE